MSGLGLAAFLPVHLYVLSWALDAEARLDTFLRWTDQPLVKLAETVLVVLLAVHMTDGLRVLAVEFLPWRDWQKTLIASAFGLAVAAGLAFALNAA